MNIKEIKMNYPTRNFDLVINGHHVCMRELVEMPIDVITKRYGELSLGQVVEIKELKNLYFGRLNGNTL